jgi:hypothetical protein
MENQSPNLEIFYQEPIDPELEKKVISEFLKVFIKVTNINNCLKFRKSMN